MSAHYISALWHDVGYLQYCFSHSSLDSVSVCMATQHKQGVSVALVNGQERLARFTNRNVDGKPLDASFFSHGVQL